MNQLNEQGFMEFQAGRYAAAAQSFRDAYAEVPDPNLRKNEAVAWFKAGRCQEAVPAANAFLIAASGSQEDAVEARSIVANCKVEMARSAIAAGSLSLAERLLVEAESLEPDQYARDQIGLAHVELATARQQDGGGPSLLGWALVGTGAAIIGGTIVYWLLTIPDRRDSNELPITHPNFDRVNRRARTSRWLVPAALAAGTALTGLGVYLVLTPRRSTADDATAHLGVRYHW